MWKYVTRGIRETLERRASCRTNVYSQTTPDSSASNKCEVKHDLVKNQKFLAPNLTNCGNGFFGSAKTGGPKDKKHDSKWDTRRSWSEAVGWSSVLAVGWVVCQSLCLRRRLFERSKEDKWHNRLLEFQGVTLPSSLVDVFNVHRQNVLPVTNCVASHSCDLSDERLQQQWTEPRPYGPITIEEALKEAKDNYTRTHRFVMGEFELRFGVKALEEQRYKDALKHFSTGARLSSSGSMFNLGLCHELGIGTVTDAKKAAKYYKEAAEKGHPDAMYNLGVFHAQGRGGLTLDIEKARELFTEAANLGQIQARVALELEKTVAIKKNNAVNCEPVDRHYRKTDKIQNKQPKRNLLQMSGFNDNSINEDFQKQTNSESSYFDESHDSVQNSTEFFLNSLGIQTNPVPILVGSSDSNVSYYN